MGSLLNRIVIVLAQPDAHLRQRDPTLRAAQQERILEQGPESPNLTWAQHVDNQRQGSGTQ